MAKQIEMRVEGMHCTGCESNLRFALSSLPGVELAKANHKARTVAVVFDPEATSEAEIRAAIEQIGYEVSAAAE